MVKLENRVNYSGLELKLSTSVNHTISPDSPHLFDQNIFYWQPTFGQPNHLHLTTHIWSTRTSFTYSTHLVTQTISPWQLTSGRPEHLVLTAHIWSTRPSPPPDSPYLVDQNIFYWQPTFGQQNHLHPTTHIWSTRTSFAECLSIYMKNIKSK